ncbi:hypothetical protein EW026_g2759 [Hermanssonia centrifuga]|uniref:Uncharacterized protein n=1 Tax=Hermanssonia centrifuga TaxID=98765 RepID=A0A4S4KM93_9APHY|nr:hypothetical protein EW026_g2759 [Hermanssonia centrifuga]
MIAVHGEEVAANSLAKEHGEVVEATMLAQTQQRQVGVAWATQVLKEVEAEMVDGKVLQVEVEMVDGEVLQVEAEMVDGEVLQVEADGEMSVLQQELEVLWADGEMGEVGSLQDLFRRDLEAQLAASTRGKPVDSGWASKSKMASKPHDTPSGWGDSAATPWGDTGGPSAWQPEANSAPAMTFGGGDASGGWGGVSSAPGWPSDVHATSTGWDASPSATQWGAAGAAEGSGGGQWSSGGGNMTAGGWNISETSSKDQKQNRPYGPNEPANPRLSAAAGNDFTSSSMPQDDSGSYPMRSPASTLRRLNERDHEPCNETKGKRSDSESRNDSRAASPCESSSSGRLPEYREYIRALLRTLDLFTESQKAEEDLNWSAHMQRHEHHARRGEWGQDVLNITKKDMQQKSRSAKKRYEAALNVLSTLPIINPATMASANPNEDLTQMQAYMKELENWMEQVRPVIAQTCNAIANQPQDEPAVESRVATKDDPSLIPIQKLWATAKKLEKKLSSLEVYHEEMRGNSTVNTPGPRLSASESETLRVRCQETEREIEDMNDALLLIRKDVDKLVRRTSEREIEIQSVRAENESLKAKIAQTQQFDAVLTQQFQEASTEMTALKKLVDDLVNTKPRTPHPVVSPEVVLSLLETQLKAKVRTEMEVVLGTIKQGVHEALEAQQRDLCSVVWVQLQPTLRLATVIQETVNDPQFKNLLVSPGSSHE